MKIVQWTDDDVPYMYPAPVKNSRQLTVVPDCRFWYNLEVGDLVQYITELGTSCYLVIDVQPATTSELGDGVVNAILEPM